MVSPVVESAIELAVDWYEGKRSKKGNVNTNVMCVGLAVSELLKDAFPLTDAVVKTDKGSQVRGLSGALVSRILRDHGEEQEFTSEGGRTSRGSLPTAQEFAGVLNDYFAEGLNEKDRVEVANALQLYFVRCIQRDYFAKQRMKVEIDPSKPVSSMISEILAAARNRPDQPTGAVAQHLVGAKLELRFPDLKIGRDKANAADLQTNRQGDFQLGSTAFHVTVSPMQKLVLRVRENLREGYRPVVLVPQEKLSFAIGLFESEDLGSRVGVQSIESFVGTNVEEMGSFDFGSIRVEVARLVRRYNERIHCCETDKSLMLDEPEWVVDLLGELDLSMLDYACVPFSEDRNEA